MADPHVLSQRLASATRDRRSTPRLTIDFPELDVATAYAAQWAGVQQRRDAGERIIGAKLGLTSHAKQRTMGVHEPIYGWLTDAMLADAAEPLPVDRWIHPRVEPEIGFLLGRELSGRVSVAEVLHATEAVVAAVEVIDSRYTDFDFRLPDVIADNASAAGVVIGPRLRSVEAIGDLRLLGCCVHVDGELRQTAAGAAVLGHPANAVAWLAAQLGEVGRSIPVGALVLSGALADAEPIGPGQSVAVEIEELGLVEVRA